MKSNKRGYVIIKMTTIKCKCGKEFEGQGDKEDTCPDCLKKLINPKENEKKEDKKKDDEKKKELIKQTKINIEIAISKNYNKVTIGIQDEPLNSSTEEEFRIEIKKLSAILRQEAESQLKLIQLK